MSDPQPLPGRKTPPRAHPVQPDKPGSGNSSGSDPADKPAGGAGGSPQRQKAQEEDALRNVREGYGGGG